MKEENATRFMIVLLTIVIIVICASIYKFYVVPNRRTRATNTDTESKFRLMESKYTCFFRIFTPFFFKMNLSTNTKTDSELINSQLKNC